MKTDLALRCRCGAVRGHAKSVSPATSNRIVCYCRDCQAFARFLERDELLDEAGGSDILQVAPAQLEFSEGAEHLRSMRLSDKGMVRWFVDCCKTPVANTMAGSRVSFAGLLVAFVDPTLGTPAREAALGPVIGRIFARDATASVPPGAHPKIPLSLIPRFALLFARGWRARNSHTSSFVAPGETTPRVAPRVLSPTERAALTKSA